MPERASWLTVWTRSAMIARIFTPMWIPQRISCEIHMIMGQAALMSIGTGAAGPAAPGAGRLTALGQAPDETQESQVLLHLD